MVRLAGAKPINSDRDHVQVKKPCDSWLPLVLKLFPLGHTTVQMTPTCRPRRKNSLLGRRRNRPWYVIYYVPYLLFAFPTRTRLFLGLQLAGFVLSPAWPAHNRLQVQSYEKSLQELRSGDHIAARHLLRGILDHPMMAEVRHCCVWNGQGRIIHNGLHDILSVHPEYD